MTFTFEPWMVYALFAFFAMDVVFTIIKIKQNQILAELRKERSDLIAENNQQLAMLWHLIRNQ